MPDFNKANLVLAPMDGLTDPLMRDILTRIGGFDWCVSEFVRITNSVLPKRVWYSAVPELLTNGCTAAGVPVHVQLLGSDGHYLAANAAQVASLGAQHVDLNFGCPAKTVNKHHGGAVLLLTPDKVHALVSQVRAALPASVTLSAKMRLGYNDDSLAVENADAIATAGASWLTIHARTKVDGYKPPAYWHKIAPLAARLNIPVIANGEVWSLADAANCLAQSGCQHLMLGRGAIRHPDLALQILGRAALPWQALVQWQLAFLQGAAKNEIMLMGRYKQWLAMLSLGYPQAKALWQQVKQTNQPSEMIAMLEQSIS